MMSVPRTRMPGGRPFRVLWVANATSNLADGIAFVAIPLLATSLTDDPRWVAGLATLYALVRLLVALPIGVWVDRLDRRRILIVANMLRGVAVLGLAVCVHLDVGGLLLLYAAFAVIGTLESAADNAAVSLVPSIVATRDLDRANARLSAAQLVADEFAGPPLGGLLFTVAAAVPVFAMGGLWAAAGLVALGLPMRRVVASDVPETPRRSVAREAASGASWLIRHRVVGGLAVVGALASVGYMLPFSILVVFAQEQLGLDGTGYGVILAASALGGLVGSFATPRVRRRLGYRWTIVASLLIGAASLLILAVTRDAVVAAVLLAAYILHAVAWGICSTSLRQRLVPEELRGRINAASRVAGLLGLALGSLLGGVLAAMHVALPVAVGGAVFVACAVIAIPLLRTVDDE
ncbi:MAG: putative transporter [Microbacterium sp.]|nr:putative transporter [Microbacterium sp.]